MRKSAVPIFAGFAALAASCSSPPPAPTAPKPTAKARDFAAEARELSQNTIIIDGHIDVPYRLENSKAPNGKLTEDVAGPTTEGDFDYPRAKKGGLDAPFMSIYVPARYQETGGAKKLADKLIDMVELIVKRAPDRFALAHSTRQLEANAKAGLISLPLGIENGTALEGKIENVAHFARRGVRYITLTHSENNKLGDSSYADTKRWKGLSPLGRRIVREMNRQGILVDVSHVSDDTFHDVLGTSAVPVIASHSSCRHFTPGFERNMADDMIRKLAEADGVVMINFGSSFIASEALEAGRARREALKELKATAQKSGEALTTKDEERFEEKWAQEHPYPFATVENVADHIDHVVKLVGIDHVGFGSDFDGVGDTLPVGLKDVAQYPNLIRVLLERGYSPLDIKKLSSENVLRVWRATETFSGTASP